MVMHYFTLKLFALRRIQNQIKIIYKFYQCPNNAMENTIEYKRVLIRVSSTFDNLETGGFAPE